MYYHTHMYMYIYRLCTEKATGQRYAVKIVSQRHRPTREVSILQLCQGHPNVVHLHEVLSDEVGGVTAVRLDYTASA